MREIQVFKKMLASAILYVLCKKKYFPIFYFAIVMAIHQIDFMSTDVSQTSV